MWTHAYLEIGGKTIEYWVKHYDEVSEFGIDGGRVSKLTVKHNDKTIANYDRGWDVKPTTELAKQAVAKLLKTYN